jgi:hypothetical protein
LHVGSQWTKLSPSVKMTDSVLTTSYGGAKQFYFLLSIESIVHGGCAWGKGSRDKAARHAPRDGSVRTLTAHFPNFKKSDAPFVILWIAE